MSFLRFLLLQREKSCGKLKKKRREEGNMASKKISILIKEARVNAGLTQEQLARKIAGLSASDISLAERGKKELTQDQLKRIAKATGVTQASLLNASKGSAASTSSKTSIKVTATEKKLVELYRAADSATRKEALKVLKGDNSLVGDVLDTLLDNVSTDDIMDTLLDSVQDMLSKK